MKKTSLIVRLSVIVILLSAIAFSVSIQLEPIMGWVATYNSDGNNLSVPFALAIDPAGNVYVTGYTSAGGKDHEEM